MARTRRYYDSPSKLGVIYKFAEWKLKMLELLSPLVNLGVRIWVANVFWSSGILKLPAGFLGVGKGNWETTLYLFTSEHPVPFLSPQVAAFSGTFFEIVCSILLVLGLGTRSAAFIFLIMSAVIELTYEHAIEHQYWMILCAFLIFYGGGKISLDYLIRKKLLASSNYRNKAGIKKW